MRLVVDSHTHSISSGHAYSTIQEMAGNAKENGIEMFAVTDHGPALPGAPHIFHFMNMKVIPSRLSGVRVLKGTEANIIRYDGSLDIPDYCLKRLDFVIVAFHDVCIEPSTMKEHTQGMINALKNPYVDAVAHPGNPVFQVDIPEVVKAAKQLGKAIEINNHSFRTRKGSEENCSRFARECADTGTSIVCGSDAHIGCHIGSFENVTRLLEMAGVPESCILNTSVEAFDRYLSGKSTNCG